MTTTLSAPGERWKVSKLFLKNAETLAGNIFGLPNHHKLRNKEILKIVNLMKKLEKNVNK